MKVGQDASGSAAIEGGRLKLDKTLTNATMQDFLDRRNMTMEEVDKLNKTSERKKAFFFMEPGRCMHQNLYAIGFSHRKSKMRGRTVCIKSTCVLYFGIHIYGLFCLMYGQIGLLL